MTVRKKVFSEFLFFLFYFSSIIFLAGCGGGGGGSLQGVNHTEDTGGWTVTEPFKGGFLGTGIGIDRNGNPCVAFRGDISYASGGAVVANGGGDILFARAGSSSWTVEEVARSSSTGSSMLQLAFDSSGNPCVMNNGNYYYFINGRWLEDSYSAGNFFSAFLEPSGVPHALFLKTPPYEYVYVKRTGQSNWQEVPLTLESNSLAKALVVDGDGAPWVIYLVANNDSTSTIKAIRYLNGSWGMGETVVANVSNTIYSVVATAAPDNTLYVAYSAAIPGVDGNASLHIHYRRASGWQGRQISSLYGLSPSIKAGPSGTVCIFTASYQWAYCFKGALDSWSRECVFTPSQGACSSPSVALDSNGTAYVAFCVNYLDDYSLKVGKH